MLQNETQLNLNYFRGYRFCDRNCGTVYQGFNYATVWILEETVIQPVCRSRGVIPLFVYAGMMGTSGRIKVFF
jgi:hypothetical protein